MILSSPLSEETVRSLKIGDLVYVSGTVVTGRDAVHMRALEYLSEGKRTPSELQGSTLYHCGPIIEGGKGEWKAVAAGPTTSARMNSLAPEMIRRFGIRAVIGKGGMSKEVSEAMEEVGCVYLAATGGAAVTLANGLSKITGVEWQDLGMAEAMWRFEADRLGPLVVAMDAKGNSLYEEVRKSLVR